MLTKKFCPRCGSENVQVIAGGIIGTWMCADCGFSGSVFPEKEIIGKNLATEKDSAKERKR